MKLVIPDILKKINITVVPRTTLGKWSVGLIGGLVLFFALMLVLLATGQRGGETFFSNPALALPTLLAAISGIAAFFTGIVGIIRGKERSVLVFLAAVIGLFVLLFCLGEVLCPC
jgi:hypothetical protein